MTPELQKLIAAAGAAEMTLTFAFFGSGPLAAHRTRISTSSRKLRPSVRPGCGSSGRDTAALLVAEAAVEE